MVNVKHLSSMPLSFVIISTLLFCSPLSCSSPHLSFSDKHFYKRALLRHGRIPSSREDSSSEIIPLDLNSLDSEKPTVCSITLNSEDERNVFKQHLKDRFNFIELVDPNDEEWLKKSCQSQIQCDVLLISGHFGGTFFGVSGKISMEKLENNSCQSSCDGVFQAPKEVFLFGCNTMAGKKPDSRTMQEYADILYNQHRDVYTTRLMAEEAAAYRYSPLGAQTQDRMRSVFKNSRIYGFYSTAPIGPNIKPRLHNYLQSIPSKDYKTHLKQFPTEAENTLWSKSMEGQYIRSMNGAKSFKNPICTLFGSDPIYKKLDWINRVFTDDSVLTYAPNINEYLSSLEKRFGSSWDNWPKPEVSYMEYLRYHKKAKIKIGGFLENPIEGLITVQFKLLGLGSKLGWYTPSEKRDIQNILLGNVLLRNLSLEEKDLICSLDIQINLKLEDLPQEEWNKYTIKALGCTRPPNEAIHMALTKVLTDSNKEVRSSAVWALGKIKPQSVEVLTFITELLTHEKKYVRSSAVWALEKIKPQSVEVLTFITELLTHEKEYVRSSAAKVLGKIKPPNEFIHMALTKVLTDSDWLVRSSAVWALEKIKPQSVEVLTFITELLTHEKEYVRSSAAKVLGKIKPPNEFIHMALTKVLTDSNKEVRSSAVWALGKIKPQSVEVLTFITELLTHEKEYVRSSAAKVLERIKPQSEFIHMALTKVLTDSNKEVRFWAVWALGEIKPQSVEVLTFITELLTHEKEYVRSSAVWALGKIKPPNEFIHMALTKVLTDSNKYVRSSAVWALGKIKPQSVEVLTFITELLTHEKEYVRSSAAKVLGEIQ